MKILIVKTAPGEIVIKNSTYNIQEIGLAKALIELGNQCDVMCCADGQPSEKIVNLGNGKEIRIYCAKAVQYLKNGLLKNVESIFEKYDLFQVSEYNQLYTWYMAKKYSDKTIVYHGPYYCDFNKRYNLMAKWFDKIFLKRYIRLNTVFITKSDLAKEYLFNKGIKNITSIGVGIDIKTLMTSAADHLNFVDEINKYQGRKVMYIGRIEPRRNSMFLLDIVKQLNETEPTYLILVGEGEKLYVKDFFVKSEQYGISNKIIYRERVEQKYMQQLYGCTDIFLLPTFYDIYGMVLLEAMYFGKAVVTTLNGGSSMMIQNGINGYIIEKFFVEEWCHIIEELFIDEYKRRKISNAAHHTVNNYYTWQVLSRQFVEVYKRKISDSMNERNQRIRKEISSID